MCEHIERLKELTPILPEVPTLESLKEYRKDGFVEYTFESGTAISFSLYDDKDISIAKTFISENTIFEDHIHEGYEIVIVLKGTLELNVGKKQKKIILTNQEKFNITQNQVHSAKALTDVWLIALTVPQDNGYPKKHRDVA